jgi:FdhD protein
MLNHEQASSPVSAQSAAEVVAAVEVLDCRAGARSQRKEDTLAREEPLEIRIRGRSIAVTMRTPGNDRELAAGFLFTEGIIHQRRDVIDIAPCLQSDCPENVLNVVLAPALEVDFQRLTRHVFATSSCGLCGKASIDAVHQNFPPVQSDITVLFKILAELPGRMREAQRTFDRTGGLHAAAVFDANGGLIGLCEDVGRHNAVDKVIGQGFLNGQLPFGDHILLVSGRASFEIMQKALAARIPIVCAISAPSSLAVEFANESGQTLVGFLRDGGMNVYSRSERVNP